MSRPRQRVTWTIVSVQKTKNELSISASHSTTFAQSNFLAGSKSWSKKFNKSSLLNSLSKIYRRRENFSSISSIVSFKPVCQFQSSHFIVTLATRWLWIRWPLQRSCWIDSDFTFGWCSMDSDSLSTPSPAWRNSRCFTRLLKASEGLLQEPNIRKIRVHKAPSQSKETSRMVCLKS